MITTILNNTNVVDITENISENTNITIEIIAKYKRHNADLKRFHLRNIEHDHRTMYFGPVTKTRQIFLQKKNHYIVIPINIRKI